MANSVISTLNRWKSLKQKKQVWLDHWQLLGEYVHTRKQTFTSEHTPGEFLNRELFDSTGPRSSRIAASSINSMLWPQTNNRLALNPPKSLQGTKEEKEYYEFATDKVLSTLDNPQGGFQTALDEYMNDQMVFATAGIESVADPETRVMYRPWGVKHLTIAEGKNGFVDTTYIDTTLTVGQMVEEYGLENVSETVRSLFKNEKLDDDVELLIAIEPRRNVDRSKRGNRSMPWKSQHIEPKNKHVLRESGFNETSIKVGRFSKLIGEVYGRGFGMDALPDILEINAIWEAVTVAIEKLLDPPLGVLDDGRLGGTEIDTSAGAINVFNISGRAGEKNPIFPLFTVGELKQVVGLIEKLEKNIGDHFSIDRLLDFNNETRMTLGEAQLRDRLRNATLGSVFSRQIAEVISPTVIRTFNLLLEQGELGVRRDSVDALTMRNPVLIPDTVVELMETGQDVYDIEYFTPAQRIIQAEEAAGITRTWEMAGQIQPVVPDVVDNLDADVSIRRFRQIVGGPSEMERSTVEVKQARRARAEMIENKEEQDAALQATEAIRNVGQANLKIPGVGAA